MGSIVQAKGGGEGHCGKDWQEVAVVGMSYENIDLQGENYTLWLCSMRMYGRTYCCIN